MEVHFTPDQEAELAQIALHTGTDTERLVRDAALRLVTEQARLRVAVRDGVVQADRGELVEDEEVSGCGLNSKNAVDSHSLDDLGR